MRDSLFPNMLGIGGRSMNGGSQEIKSLWQPSFRKANELPRQAFEATMIELGERFGLSANEVRENVQRHRECERSLQSALSIRLRHVADHGDAEQLRAFLWQIPKMDEQILVSRLSNNSDLKPLVRQARSTFATVRKDLLKHIAGPLPETQSRLQSGGHVHSIFDDLADRQTANWTEQQKALFATAIATIDRKEKNAIIKYYRGLGFGLSGTRWSKLLLKERRLFRIQSRPNGVICLRLPKSFFEQKAWDISKGTARHGVSPIGCKTLFPFRWRRKHISEAIVSVLKSRDPHIVRVRRSASGTATFFYMRAIVKGVHMEVGIGQDGVKTAFPSWLQHHADTIKEAYQQYYEDYHRLAQEVERVLPYEPAFRHVPFPAAVIEGYLGKNSSGLVPPVVWSKLQSWLNPDCLSVDKPRLLEALTLQLMTFELMCSLQTVRQIEGVPTPP
jgi:hypothetical protein